MSVKYDTSAINQALALLEKQYGQVNDYFAEAGSAFEQQFSTLQGNTMGAAVNSLANAGIYDSPIGEKQLNQKRIALGETYANAKSQLAGQKLSAISQIDQQKVSYLQQLADAQYKNALAKQQQKSNTWGMITGGIGAIVGTIASPGAGTVAGWQIGNQVGSQLG